MYQNSKVVLRADESTSQKENGTSPKIWYNEGKKEAEGGQRKKWSRGQLIIRVNDGNTTAGINYG